MSEGDTHRQSSSRTLQALTLCLSQPLLKVGRVALDGNGEVVEAEGLAARGVDVAAVVHLFGRELQLVEAAAFEQLLGIEPRAPDVRRFESEGAGLHRAYIENVLFHGV